MSEAYFLAYVSTSRIFNYFDIRSEQRDTEAVKVVSLTMCEI